MIDFLTAYPPAIFVIVISGGFCLAIWSMCVASKRADRRTESTQTKERSVDDIFAEAAYHRRQLVRLQDEIVVLHGIDLGDWRRDAIDLRTIVWVNDNLKDKKENYDRWKRSTGYQPMKSDA